MDGINRNHWTRCVGICRKGTLRSISAEGSSLGPYSPYEVYFRIFSSLDSAPHFSSFTSEFTLDQGELTINNLNVDLAPGPYYFSILPIYSREQWGHWFWSPTKEGEIAFYKEEYSIFTTNCPSWTQDCFPQQPLSLKLTVDRQLPVELSHFDVKTDGTDAFFTWVTTSETNNAGFYLQHVRPEITSSIDSFEDIAYVEGVGTTQLEQHYSHQVAGLEPGQHRFRLRQVDFDGTVAFSDVVEATVKVPGSILVSEVYPNPIEGQANVRIVPAATQELVVGLYDLLGRQVRQVYKGRGEANKPLYIMVNSQGLPAGTYLLQIVTSTSLSYTQKLIVAAR